MFVTERFGKASTFILFEFKDPSLSFCDKTVDEFKKMSQSYWDSLASLRKNLTVLTTAIQFANSTNMVNIKGFGEISIAAALELHENEFPYDKRNRRRTSKLNIFHSAIVSESARKLDERNKKIIAIEKPLRIVFRDSGFNNDTSKMNVKQLLRQLSPETEMKVI